MLAGAAVVRNCNLRESLVPCASLIISNLKREKWNQSSKMKYGFLDVPL